MRPSIESLTAMRRCGRILMNFSPSAWIPSIILLAIAGATSAFGGEQSRTLPEASKGTVDFRKDVFPLLKSRCFRCHAGRDAESGYRLDVRAEILGETNGEPLVVVGKSAASRLVQLVARVDADAAMPPEGEGKPLDEQEIGIVRAWIDQGLRWDDKLLPPPREGSDHWAFQTVKRPQLPHEFDRQWARTPVDAFVSAKHIEHRLKPASEANRPALIVRLSLDLKGLPPSPEEVEAFVSDPSPDAYEQLVERLLTSPHYGERWGRHWLDVARWAESEGYESNHDRPFAWRYRDWVVDAFNADKPYDQFVTQQLAGDELVPYSDENIIATGFLASARISSNEEDKALQRNDTLVDIVNATGSAFFGLTIGCAQCHNHKFDPITQRDYYRLQGFFRSGMPNNLQLTDETLWREYRAQESPEYESLFELKHILFERGRQAYIESVKQDFSAEMLAALTTPEEERTPRQRELYRQADLQFQQTPGGYERHIPEQDKKLYNEAKRKLEAIEKQMLPKPQTWGFYSPATSQHSLAVLPQIGFYPLPYEPDELRRKRAYLLIRGDVHRRGPPLVPGWPAVLVNHNPTIRQSDVDSCDNHAATREAGFQRPRTELAQWLTNRENPLTARVWVNRIWQHHFGRGIVATPSDLGTQGAAPTHPELLDWLAAELVDSGWSTKHIHRLIVLSATYRQASTTNQRRAGGVSPLKPHSEKNHSGDPENNYLWHFPIRRLEAEAIRDRALAASGELHTAVGGPSTDNAASPRRTLYLHQKRDAFPELQRLFDTPSANESCARRHVSTVALQPLYLLNSPFMVARAKAAAERIQNIAGDDVARQIEAAFKLVLLRDPDEKEHAAAREFLLGDTEATNDARLAQLCQALMNANEFIYLE